MKEYFASIFVHGVKESTGSLRFISSALAMINVAPLTRVVGGSTGRYAAHGKSVPHLGHETITIRAGLKLRHEAVNEAFEYHARRWHEVRGHWRDTERGRALGCSHVPVEREGRYALCSNCQHLIVWVDKHERGDETLGRVEHNYKVTM